MFPPNTQPLPTGTAPMQVDQAEKPVIEVQNGGGYSQVESLLYSSKKLQDDLQMLGMKIKQHEESMKFLRTQKNKLDESILDLQVTLGKHHSSSTAKDQSHPQSEEEATEKILRHEKTAAGILCQLRTRHVSQASSLTLTKDVLGVVATLGKADDDNISRLLSEYLGIESMLAIVCKTYDGVNALETYDREGSVNDSHGLHGLGASIGRTLTGRFLVICLENLRPYAGDFVPDDPQRRLDLLKPKLPNGELPPGFLGFAVNMIHLDITHLLFLTPDGYGLRETLFYSLFSRLQVYKTRTDMLQALPCISDGAISLDGGVIKTTGLFYLGKREEVEVRFPKLSMNSSLPETYIESERQMKEMKWKKEKTLEDMKREQALLDNAKFKFDKKKAEFLKFLAQSSSYAAQYQAPAMQDLATPR